MWPERCLRGRATLVPAINEKANEKDSCPRGRATLVPALNERVHVAGKLPKRARHTRSRYI